MQLAPGRHTRVFWRHAALVHNGTVMNDNIALKDLFNGKKEIDLSTLSFEQSLKLLEELVASVESGSLPLDKAILSYEKGVQLVNQMRTLLSGAEEKLKVLQKS